MIVLERYQVERISKKISTLGQCEWFRKTYGCTMEVKGKYYLEFNTEKEETFFLLKYSSEINNPSPSAEEEIVTLINNWSLTDDWDIDDEL